MELSLVIPSRNNLQYFKWAYDSIRKNQGKHEVYICAANDASTDGTWDFFWKLRDRDDHFSFINNPGPERFGHTILYDRIIEQLVQTDVFGIFHADMYLCPGALDRVEQLLKHRTVVSLTRIEPPIWPPGPEKVIQNFGTEPSEFDEQKFLDWYSIHQSENIGKISHGFFAPWFLYKNDFLGHDPLFKPQSREDSCLGNRFQLSGYEFIQPRDANVYHLTCRGSRRNPNLTDPVLADSDEWTIQNRKSERNFYRKWGSDIQVDKELRPIVLPKYKTYCILRGATLKSLELLEPVFTKIFVDLTQEDIDKYISSEQPKTLYDLRQRVFNIDRFTDDYGILVDTIGAGPIPDYNIFKNIGLYQWHVGQEAKNGITKFTVKDLTQYERENLDENLVNQYRI